MESHSQGCWLNRKVTNQKLGQKEKVQTHAAKNDSVFIYFNKYSYFWA